MAKKRHRGTLEKHLMAYSAAAAGVLALAPSAEATIQYFNTSHAVPYTVNMDSVNVSRFFVAGSAARVQGTGGAAVISSGNSAKKLASGFSITAGQSWGAASKFLNGSSAGPKGKFNGSTTGYIGVRFHAGACTGAQWYYGWISYTGGAGNSGTINSWAYQDSCNTPIKAGATPPASAAVPTLNQWGMIVFTLLLGGIATRRLMKREEES